MKIAACSGGLGDIIYAVRLMHLLGVKRLYMKDKALEGGGTTHSVLKDLINFQGIECLPTDGGYDFFQYDPKLVFDYDIDHFRNMPSRNKNHILKSMLNKFGFPNENWHLPWLRVEYKNYIGTDNFAIVALTPRWRERSRVNWKQVYTTIKASGYKEVYFIGFESDWKNFCEKYGEIQYFPTRNLLQCAQLINECKTLYTNQNPMLAIAQGIGKQYFLEQNPRRTNTLIYTRKENLL